MDPKLKDIISTVSDQSFKFRDSEKDKFLQRFLDALETESSMNLEEKKNCQRYSIILINAAFDDGFQTGMKFPSELVKMTNE